MLLKIYSVIVLCSISAAGPTDRSTGASWTY